MESEISEIPSVFQNLISNQSIFSEVATLIRSKEINFVLILARGTSDNAAHFLKYLVETKLGLPVGLTSPSTVTIYGSKLNFKNTLVIAISQSGQSTDLVTYATAAKSSGALLVAMTNVDSSPLANLSDLHIPLMAGQELAVAATKSYAAELLASHLLVSAWAGSGTNTDLLIEQGRALVNNKDLVTAAISVMDIEREIVVLGRGFSYANARETALKIQETSKISVQGLSIADYRHGPISALTSKTTVIICAPNGFSMQSIKSDLDQVRQRNAAIVWIGSAELAAGKDVVIQGSNCGSEILSNIADAIALQRLALEFARKNEMDPDSPAGLSKVTLTI
jgi:glucosamine--fructose-6-phosphate aminotransferase (isomerizing)